MPQCLVKKAGSCSTTSSNTPEKVIQRATAMYDKEGKKFGEYHPIENNCESFVFYCTTNYRKSIQGNSFRALIETVYQTATSGEHDSIRAIGESFITTFFTNKAKRINDEGKTGETSEEEDEVEDED
ncbi:uncharacterized protein LOC133834300 [Humulus lupulus]|uniref:uncharacterized protein LOC133834300 n=1 Tax=Humulus lupulus TaxID=3486 RepID=UPI002B404792|nr:uncharacterized protein LOC133834300 [Humulus lupulus]